MAPRNSGVEPFPKPPRLPEEAFEVQYRPVIERFNKAFDVWWERLNGKLSLGDRVDAASGHVDGEVAEVVVPTANTDFPVIHNLGRVPLGFIVLSPFSASPLHKLDSTPGDSNTQLWVRSAAAAGSRYRILIV